MIYLSTSCLQGSTGRYERDVFKVLDVYQKLGVQYAELGAAHDPVQGLSRLKDYGMHYIVHCVFPPVKPPVMMNFAGMPDIRERSIAIAKAGIDFCRRFDAPLYSCHTGFLAEIDPLGGKKSRPITKEQALPRIVAALREVCDAAEASHVKVAVENSTGKHPWLLALSSAEYKDLLAEVHSRSLGLLVDLGHLGVASRTRRFDAVSWLCDLQDRVLEFHVHDLIDGVDHQALQDSTVLQRFGIRKDVAHRSYLTIESHKLSPDGLTRSLHLLDRSLQAL